MRILPIIAATTLAGLALVPGASAAVKPTCAKDGVCFTKQINGAKKTITVTGTAGNDKIVLTNKAAFGNNSNSHIAVQGIDTQIDATGSVTLVVNGLAGDDQINLPVLVQPSIRQLYAVATLDGGAGNDTITGGDRPDVMIGGAGRDVLDGGRGDDQLRALDGEVDVLHGGLGTDSAQRDAADKVDGVEG
jgi:Ca2+-binding RTX toxin-like protein